MKHHRYKRYKANKKWLTDERQGTQHYSLKLFRRKNEYTNTLQHVIPIYTCFKVNDMKNLIIGKEEEHATFIRGMTMHCEHCKTHQSFDDFGDIQIHDGRHYISTADIYR
jgi:hypothetical protein